MVKEYKKPKQISRWTPIFGFLIAVSVGVLAYFLAPIVIDLIRDYIGQAQFDRRLGNLNETVLHLSFAAVLWLVLFALSMLLVAAAIGEDPDIEERLVKPRKGDKKGWKKYRKQQKKIAKRKKEIVEKLKAQEDE